MFIATNCNLCVSQMGRFLMGRFLNVVGVALLGDPKIGSTGRRRQRPLHIQNPNSIHTNYNLPIISV